jgi:glycosyltransferase involved in cell wall biosynthesis
MPASEPLLSAIVCTLDRKDDLKKCLKALDREIDGANGRLRVLVVDNGSTDGTAEMLNQWKDEFRLVHHEHRKGLSVARNSGLQMCDAPWVAYLDDDAVVHEAWFSAFEAAIAEYPEMQAGGGRVILKWPVSRPDFVRDEDLELYSTIDLGSENRILEYDEIPVGANMFFRKDLLVDIGGFPENLGRVGRSLISGEESFVIRKIQARSIQLHYLGKMAVDHLVSKERASYKWLRKRKIAEGVSQMRMDWQMEKIPVQNLRRFLFEYKRWLKAIRRGDQRSAWVYGGRWKEYWRLWR